jgi:glycosyltransferase involved in cell wall biosynthesis
MTIAIIINRLLHTCGITNHVYNFLSEAKQDSRFRFIIISGGGQASQQFEKMGVKTIIRPDFAHEERSYFGYLRAITALAKIIKSENINIIHSHHFYAASIAKRCSKFLPVMTVQTNHGLIPGRGKLNHFSADYFVGVNEHIIEYLLAQRISTEKNTRLIRVGQPKLTQHREQLQKIKMIAASRLVYEKGLDVYISAVGQLPPQLLELSEFYLAGEGKQKEELLATIQERGVPIKYIGEIPHLSEKLYQYDAFIFPSRSAAEGFPAALIEAGMQGLFIITAAFRGLHPVFDGAKHGLVFKQDSSEELAGGISEYITNREQFNSRADAFRKKVEELYNLKKRSEELLDYYSKIWETRKRKAGFRTETRS